MYMYMYVYDRGAGKLCILCTVCIFDLYMFDVHVFELYFIFCFSNLN